MIIRENELIDMVTSYLSSLSNDPLYIGAMIGTQVFKHVMDVSLNYTDFANILIIEGIQDFIGLRKESQYMNHIFYAEGFHNQMITLAKDKSTIEKFFKDKENIQLVPEINYDLHADIIIINDAHMIPKIYLDQILTMSKTKTILIVDPYDVNGESYANVDTVVETITAVSNLIAKAREIYGIESYAVDKKIHSILDEAKMTKRSIGKIDENQYVTNDEDLLTEVNLRQLLTPFKRRQKLLVLNDNIIHSPLLHEEATRECILVKHSIAHISGISKDSRYVRLRPHSYKKFLFGRISYSETDDPRVIHCKPGNILSVNEAAYHRFPRIICALKDGKMTVRQMYSLLKNTNHLTLVK